MQPQDGEEIRVPSVSQGNASADDAMPELRPHARGISPLAAATEYLQFFDECQRQMMISLAIPLFVPLHKRLWFVAQQALKIKRICYEEKFRCWCGSVGVFEDMFTDLSNERCGGLGFLNCECGGCNLCVCHNHGEVECDGCEDCHQDDDDFWDEWD